MHHRRYFAAAILSLALGSLALVSCDRPGPGEPEEQPAPPVEGAASLDAFEKMAADNLAAANDFLEQNAAREGIVVTPSGLQYVVLKEGPDDGSAAGASPLSSDLVVFDFSLTGRDGVEIDSSRARGAAALVRVADLGVSAPGLTEGLQLMSEGDRFRFFIPPALGLGENVPADGPIGPNEVMIFDIALHKVHNPARNLAASQAFLAENARKQGVKTTPSGLQYEVLSEGPADGATPSETSRVKVHYQGALVNGTEFDSSYARGEPIEFPLDGVIAGWTEGLQLMSVGDKYRLFIPPALGYGANGSGPIGPNEALIFEVELLDVN